MMAFISSSVTFPSAVGFIWSTSNKNSVDVVSNQINGAVIIETIFIGHATALAIPSGWFSPILLGNNSPKTKEKNVNTTTTIPTAIECANGTNTSNPLTNVSTSAVILSPL